MNNREIFNTIIAFFDVDSIKNYLKENPKVAVEFGAGLLVATYAIRKYYDFQCYKVDANRPLALTGSTPIVDAVA